ncbi:MAG: PP0621 family protein [Alcanivorax sp.]|nr:PP0621 family protein [Alcanivorax sp.]
MGFIRLLIIGLLLYLAWRVVKQLLPGAPSSTSQNPSHSDDAPEQMVKCMQCGVHVPASEAFSYRGQHFCSQEHQRQYLEHHDR